MSDVYPLVEVSGREFNRRMKEMTPECRAVYAYPWLIDPKGRTWPRMHDPVKIVRLPNGKRGWERA